MNRSIPRISLKTQLLLPFCLLLLVPLLGYVWINNWSAVLEEGQQEALLRSAETMALALEQRLGQEDILDVGETVIPGKDLYAHQFMKAIDLDGKKDEWVSIYDQAEQYDESNLIEINFPYGVESLVYRMMLYADDDYLYVFLEVTDDTVIYREINHLSVHRNDHIQLAFKDKSGEYQRYTIATHQPTQIKASVISPTGRALRQESLIQGTWLATESGYNLEFRIPKLMVGTQFAIAVADVDDPLSREIKYIMGGADPREENALGTILITSTAVEEFMSSLATSEIALVDANYRVIAEVRNTERQSTLWDNLDISVNTRWAELFQSPPASDNNENAINNPRSQISGKHVESALAGRPSVNSSTRTENGKILSAAYPLHVNDELLGAVVINQSNKAIIRLRGQAFSNLLLITLGLLVAGFGLWAFTSSMIVRRIRDLGSELESAVDIQGRLHEITPTTVQGDEIGELSQRFANMVKRLRQYNEYLESMAGRLTHELRTPVSVVRSSLENLVQEELNSESAIYVERAYEGVNRLTTILNNISEATRLEQSLDETEIEPFDLIDLIRGCVNGYELAFPDNQFILSIETSSVKLTGLPDLFAQMLDKLVNNAVEFTDSGNPVKIRLTVEDDEAVLRIINDGPPLPQEMRDKIFDSMVSLRKNYGGSRTHLGLGLYVARLITEFHGGTISASDREDSQGVIVTVRIPLMRLSVKLRQ